MLRELPHYCPKHPTEKTTLLLNKRVCDICEPPKGMQATNVSTGKVSLDAVRGMPATGQVSYHFNAWLGGKCLICMVQRNTGNYFCDACVLKGNAGVLIAAMDAADKFKVASNATAPTYYFQSWLTGSCVLCLGLRNHGRYLCDACCVSQSIAVIDAAEKAADTYKAGLNTTPTNAPTASTPTPAYHFKAWMNGGCILCGVNRAAHVPVSYSVSRYFCRDLITNHPGADTLAAMSAADKYKVAFNTPAAFNYFPTIWLIGGCLLCGNSKRSAGMYYFCDVCANSTSGVDMAAAKLAADIYKKSLTP